jgi:uncharacterized protein YjiS (DUF1127 family)
MDTQSIWGPLPPLTTRWHRPSLLARAAALLRRARERYGDWRARRATINILRGLDERTLRDIGIDASEIRSLVYDRRAEHRRRYDEGWWR